MVVTTLALAWLGLAAAGGDGTPPVPAGVDSAEPPPRSDSEDPERASRSGTRALAGATFARVDELALTLPHATPWLVAFGEGNRSDALALQPVGRLLRNEHHRFEPGRDVRGSDYVVLPSEGKPRAATSAVDVVVPAGAPVLAPVTGRVTQVREYAMEGGVRDYRVVIEPEDQPSLHVVLVHLHEPSVRVDDAVTAGQTPLGVVRLLPSERAVDALLDERHPHVHIEVTPAVEPDPADPNQPAAVPEKATARGR